MKPRLVLTRAIPEAAINKLREYFELWVNPYNRPMSHAELRAKLPNAEAMICLLTDDINRDVINSAPKLKVISAYAVGYNNIDVDYATSKHIAVCNTAGALTESTADLTWALIMATCRRITESEAFLRSGKFRAWEPMLMLGQDVYNKTLGIIGMGRIGQAVARRASGFNMKILYSGKSPKELPFPAEWVSFEYLMKNADVISLHAPLNKDTKHMINKAAIAMMKPSSVLINTARGAIVDENELILALSEKRIFAAGFDVYEHEPMIPEELLKLDNVVLLPHIGSASIETRTAMGIMAAENAIAIMEGRRAPSQVNAW